MGSDFLFAKPSFWSGVARAVDLGATFTNYNISPTEAVADERALRSDWRVVGEDLKKAIRQHDCDDVKRQDPHR